MNEIVNFEVMGQGGLKGAWNLSLDAGALTLTAAGRYESYRIPKADADEKVMLRGPRSSKPFLLVHVQPKKRGLIKLKPSQAETVQGWLGPPTMRGLKVALRRRLRWCLPIGLLFVLASIPLPADAGAGLEAVPFDAVTAFLGVSLIVISIFSNVWPRRVLFLLDGTWLILLALDVTVDIVRGDSPLWAILVIVLILTAKEGFAEYRRFASVSYA